MRRSGSTDVSALALRALPERALKVHELERAPERLLAHHRLVHDVAHHVVDAVRGLAPGVSIDHELVFLGASTHDIGKARVPRELLDKGHEHERVGEALLLSRGFSAAEARFARTHADWREVVVVEDLLVALADKVWKGKRDEELEGRLIDNLADAASASRWSLYSALDEALTFIASGSDERLLFQDRFSASGEER